MEEKTTVIEEAEEVKEKESKEGVKPDTIEMPAVNSEKAGNKKSRLLYIIIALLAVALLVMGYFLLFTGKKDAGSSGAAQIRQMQELTQQVQNMESDVKNKEDEIFSLADQVKEKTGEESLGINVMDLSDGEKQILEKRIKEEKDISVKSLLEEILEKNNEIQELRQKITEIEALLPKPHLVAKGENHYQIAMDFLVNEKGVDKKKAMELVERTALFDELVPGFKVWNFFTGDEYGSSVTQGSAAISPNTLIRRAKKQLVDARDEAIEQRDQLSEDIKVLEDKRERLITQMDSLSKEKESLIGQVGELNVQVNSLFYLLDSYNNLKEKGVIKGSALFRSAKLRDVSPEYFTQSIDLRTQSQIVFSAEELGIKRIKKITLFPKFYKEGTDYKIEISGDKLNGIITLLDPSKFKNERIVISIK